MNRARAFSVDDVLKDGTRVTIRAVRPDDRQRLLDAFKLLERDSIYTRFFGARGNPSDAELDRAVNVDFAREVALGRLATSTSASTTASIARKSRSSSRRTIRDAELLPGYLGIWQASQKIRESHISKRTSCRRKPRCSGCSRNADCPRGNAGKAA